MRAWTNDDLDRVAGAEELKIEHGATPATHHCCRAYARNDDCRSLDREGAAGFAVRQKRISFRLVRRAACL